MVILIVVAAIMVTISVVLVWDAVTKPTSRPPDPRFLRDARWEPLPPQADYWRTPVHDPWPYVQEQPAGHAPKTPWDDELWDEPAWDTAPEPGEIWIADVPFPDHSGSKVRPCLIVRVERSAVDVLKITSQEKSDRYDHIEIETSSWDPKATHNSFLDVSGTIRVRGVFLERRVGRSAILAGAVLAR